MVFELGIIILVVIVMAGATMYYSDALNKEKYKISIKESLDLVQLPIITFYEGKVKLNFLLDTGSSHSHITTSVADKLTGTPVEADYSFTSCTGSSTCSKAIDANLSYKGKEFKTTLFINKELDAAFKDIKNESGVQLHGILGSDFLKKHKYILDFAKFVAYSK